jgi:hypothetical protein
MPDSDRVLKEQSMVVRRTEQKELGLATGWSEDRTTTTYQRYARAAGSRRRIESGAVPHTVQQQAALPPDLYARRPSGVQPKIAASVTEELELDEADLLVEGNPFAPRRSAASASVWNALGFAGLFASVLIGRVIVEAGQEHGRAAETRTGAKQARPVEAPLPGGAAVGGAGATPSGSVPEHRNEAALSPETSEHKAAATALPSGDALPAPGNHLQPAAAEPTHRRTPRTNAAEPTRDLQPAAAEPTRRTQRDRSTHTRQESSDWRIGAIEPAVSASPDYVPPSATTASSAALGTLRINSRPWSEVYLDGRLIGNTPQMAVRVPVGRHTVRLSNAELGMSKTIHVQVAAGELVTRVESLE